MENTEPFVGDLLVGSDIDIVYRSVLSAVSQVALLSLTDMDGNILYVNDNFFSISKYSAAELIGQNHRILKSNQQPQELFIDLWKTISSGKVWRGEIKNRAKDGSYYWVDTSIIPITGLSGKSKRYLSVGLLITEKKRYEEDIQKFALAVQASGEHIVITDPEGITVYANPAVQETTGFSIDEMIGKEAGILWGKQMDTQFYRNFWKVIKEDKKVFRGEINNVRKNGVKYIADITISPVLDRNNNVIFFIGTERDITQLKNIDRAKTEFVSLASHQLRTPLSAINWYTEMLLDEDVGKINEDQRRYLNEIYTGSRRMVALVSDLLNVSRLDLGTFSVQPENVNLANIADSVIHELEVDIRKKKIILNKEWRSDIPNIPCDQKLIRMVFQNLLSNAIKYTPAEGRIDMSIKIDDSHQNILITVADNGIGIPKEQRNQIFSKLFRADNAKKN